MPSFAGLQTNFWTWLISAAMIGCWVISARLVPEWASDGWRALLKSLYGFVWLGFGLDIVLRFLMLSYNAVEWGNYTTRLVTVSIETVNTSLAYCGIFWLLVSLGYLVSVRRPTAGALTLARLFTVDLAFAVAIPVAVLCSVLFYLIYIPNFIPLALITPLAALIFLYSVPATIVWWDHFRRPGPAWRIGSIQLLVLLPAAVNAWRSPYRESMAPIFLIPLLGAIFAGRRPTLRKAAPVAVLTFLAVTSVITSYRLIKWQNVRPEEITSEIRREGVVNWFLGDFGDRMGRFHSFDSLLLTVHLVPNAKPYSQRNVLISPFIRAFVPRLLNENKEAADAGEKFGTGIWAYENPQQREHGGAAIAPSMPGDLYDANGLPYIVLGGLIWGLLLGLVDGWKAHLPVFSAAAITALLATHCAMSIERDFDHEVAGLIQTLIALVVVAGVIALARRRNPQFAPQFDPAFNPTPEHS